MRAHRLDADVPERWDNIRLNDAIIAQLLGSGRIPGPDLELLGWTEEMLGRLRALEARMVMGERALQGAALLFIENRHRVVQHGQTLSDLTESMGELAELRAMIRRQEETISSLTDCVTRLEGWRRRSRRGSGDSSGSSRSSVYGSAWSSSGTRVDPVVESWVEVCFLEPTSSEEERDVHVAENVRPVPVHAPTPGLSRPSSAERLGVNYNLWRNNGGTSDGDQSGSEGGAGVSEGVRRVIRGDPLVIRFGSVPPLPEYSPAPPAYISKEGPAPVTIKNLARQDLPDMPRDS